MPHDPCFAMLYGDLKTGKTSDALAAFPGAAYVAAPGALASAESLWGIPEPKAHDLGTFKEIREFGEKLPPGTIALVVDDATLIADRTGIYFRDVKHFGGFDLWGAVLNSAIKMRDSLRRRGIHVVMTSHAGGAYVENGIRHRGGPSFQGQARKKLPAAADLLLRAEQRPGDGFGWPIVYRTAPHPDWLQGSRYGTPDLCPMNLGEILRLAGFKIPRLKGLEWQDEVAGKIAVAVGGVLVAGGEGTGEKIKGILAFARDWATKKFSQDQRHVFWALRDGYDRAVLRFAAHSQRNGLWGF